MKLNEVISEGKESLEEILGDRILTVPNVISTLRLIGGSIMTKKLLVEGIPDPKKLGITYTAFMLSDKLDGTIARAFDQHSKLGEALDPLADKLLNVGILTALVKADYVPKYVLSVIVRDLYVASKAPYRKKYHYDTVTKYGKLKMVFQSLAIANALIEESWNDTSEKFMMMSLGIAAIDMVKIHHDCHRIDKEEKINPGIGGKQYVKLHNLGIKDQKK